MLGRGALTVEATQKIIEQIAPALDYAHTKNVLHRDLKPSNILMDDDGGAYITDFGIARIVGTESQGNTITTQGVVGTPSYMSPEQAQGKDMDGRSDVYALGVMIFEMTTGRRPFENDTPYGVAVMQVTTPPPSPRSINPNLSGAMEQIILKSLKKNPSNRYQTAVQLQKRSSWRLNVPIAFMIHSRTLSRCSHHRNKLRLHPHPKPILRHHTHRFPVYIRCAPSGAVISGSM